MRIIKMVPLVAVVALAACGDSAEQEETQGEGMSMDDVATEAGQAIRPNPGQYETSLELLEFDIPGLPQAQADQMRSIAREQVSQGNTFCLTPEEADQGAERMVQELAESDCVFNSFDVDGNSVVADMQCVGEEGMEGNFQLEGEMRANSSSMTMEVNQRVPGVPGEGAIMMRMRVNSQRVGECA